jgi:hypothetical protein
MTRHEHHAVELKRGYDPADRRQCMKLVKEIVALANADGGEVRIGVEDAGDKRPGVGPDIVKALDAARLSDLVDEYIQPDHLELEVVTEEADTDGQRVVVIRVPAFGAPPLVMSKDGTALKGSTQETIFRRYDVLKRRGTKADRATRDDYRTWVAAAVQEENDRWRARVAILENIPAGSTIEVRHPDGATDDDPANVLTRAVTTWRTNSAALLSGDDLLLLFLARHGLTLDRDRSALLIHSALRRKPTLYFWLAEAAPDAQTVKSILLDAIDGKDRDKSDAGRAIVEVASLYLPDDDYGQVIDALGSSRYAHFREAAADGGSRDAVLERLDGYRALKADGTPCAEYATEDLPRVADALARRLRTEASAAASRQLAALGYEHLARRRAHP